MLSLSRISWRVYLGAKPLVILFFVASLLPALSYDIAAQVNLPVTEDAYVDLQSQSTNFGTANPLRLRSLTGPNRYDQIYAKFDLSPLPPGTSASDVQSAHLKLFVTSAAANLTTTSSLTNVCAAWSELTIRYNAQPFTCGFPNMFPNTIWVPGQYVSIDVTQFVRNWLSGIANHGVTISTSTLNDIFVASKENGSNQPYIEVRLAVRSVTGNDGLTGGGSSGDLFLGILNGGVTNAKLADGAVSTSKIANGAIVNSHLTNNSVATNNIVAGAVTNTQLADGSVNAGKIADDVVVTSKLANGAVTNAKLATGSVDTPQLANNSVTSPKIGVGQVVKSVNGLTDSVTLAAGANITLTPSANTLTISSTPRFNPKQIAMLRWYETNRTAEYSGFGGPFGMVYDGQDVWVSNQGANNTQQGTTVDRIRPSDGKVLETVIVGTGPSGIAYDGAFVWVANYSSDNVMKIDPRTGLTAATYGVNDQPLHLFFDGTHIWVSHVGNQSGVTRIDARTGSILGPILMDPPNKIAYVGSNVWIANGSNKLTVRNAGTGAFVNEYIVGSAPYAVTYDGTHLWVSNVLSDNVMKIDPSNGSILATFYAGPHPRGVVFDGAHIWITNESGNIIKMRPTDGQFLEVVQTANGSFEAIFDGANILVSNTYANTISKR